MLLDWVFFSSHFAPVIMASQNAVVSRLVLMFLSSMPNFSQETNVCIQLNKEKGGWFLQWCFYWACYISAVSERSPKVACQTVFSFPNRRLIRLVGMRWELSGAKMQLITAVPPPCRLWWLPALLFKPRYSMVFDTPGLHFQCVLCWYPSGWNPTDSFSAGVPWPHAGYICAGKWFELIGVGCATNDGDDPRPTLNAFWYVLNEAYSVLVLCTEHLWGAAVLLHI